MTPKPEAFPKPRLRMERITKRFGGVHALEGVAFQAEAGQVHALCGENGAGKSTLMKILAGALLADEGQVLLEGAPIAFNGPKEAEDAGIRIIHQELNLVPGLTAAANVFLGRERTNRLGLLDDRAMETQAARLFQRLGAAIHPRSTVGDLRVGDQQMIEIAKALMFDASILIMDEPTSALSDAEVSRLFRAIADLKRAGTTILYISHKMNEVFTLADAVTVLRDGRLVNSAPRDQVDPAQVVRWMVGRELAKASFPADSTRGDVVLDVEHLSRPSPPHDGRPSLVDVSFQLHRGEVLGVAGLLGAGRTELLECLFGAHPAGPPTGSIRLQGTSVRFHTPAQAISAGLALVTEDRKRLGLFPEMTVGENITVAHLANLAKGGVVNPRAERDAVRDAFGRLAIKAAGPDAAITGLSGGNQQKCVLARWLLTGPRVLLLDEPTRGIDVGAKAEIYALLRRLAGQGMALLLTSSELPELLAVCDRILVFCDGRLTADLPRSEATEERIMSAATQFLDRTLTPVV